MDVEERAARPVCRARGTLTGRGRAYACRAGAVVVEGGRNGFLRFCFAVCPPLPPTYAASVLMVARSTPHAEARGSILRELL